MSSVVQVGPYWKGFPHITRLIVFGDSYSAVGFDLDKDAKPDDLDPLGVAFPGMTYNEPNLPNWVGHLITKYSPPPRYNPEYIQQQEGYHDRPLLVYDYAAGGDTVAGVRRQIQRKFLPGIGLRSEPDSWGPENALFVTWVGINDCAFASEHAAHLKLLFELQEELYDFGARNFLFIDVPPIHRSPAVPEHRINPQPYNNWNRSLDKAIVEFSAAHDDLSALVFSSFDLFNRLLDDPEKFGFKAEDRRRAGGGIWMDHLHPTSRVHDLIAKEIGELLFTVSASTAEAKPGPDEIIVT